MASRRSLRSFSWLAGLFVLIGIALFAVRDAQSLDNRVMRNVSINGRDVSRMTHEELDRQIAEVAIDIETMPVKVATPDGGFSATGEELGIRVDTAELRERALSINRPPALAGRLSGYFTSWVKSTSVQVPVTVSVEKTTEVLQINEGTRRRDPVDPQLKLRNGKYTVLPGSDGEGIDALRLSEAIAGAIENGERPPLVSARPVPLPSNFTTAELSALADRATDLTSRPIRFTANGAAAEITSEQLRAWLKPAIVDRQVRLTLDETKTLKGLRELVGTNIRPIKNARLTLNASGNVEVLPSETGLRCCSADAVSNLQRAFNGSLAQPVAVTLDEVQPAVSTSDIANIGVKEAVASFTTKHRSGEARVINIHRIADLTRGVVIRPGETFSVNDFVGERTEAKGFVEAHVIQDGVFKDDFGGGISQYATTLFNAAFFAGLDIPKYKPHSIYISRYPKGREATVAFPYVDLQIRNVTSYGVMIWPTYTASSITVTLYSTENMKSDVFGDPVTKKYQKCTDVVTTRLRVFPDGKEKKDTFKARYLPKEGENCDGSPTPGASTTTTTPTRRTTKDGGSSDETDGGEKTTKKRRTTIAGGDGDTTSDGGDSGDSGTSSNSGDSGDGTTKTSKKKTTKVQSEPVPVKPPKPDPAPVPDPAPAPPPAPNPEPAPPPPPAPEAVPVPIPVPVPVEVRPPVTAVG